MDYLSPLRPDWIRPVHYRPQQSDQLKYSCHFWPGWRHYQTHVELAEEKLWWAFVAAVSVQSLGLVGEYQVFVWGVIWEECGQYKCELRDWEFENERGKWGKNCGKRGQRGGEIGEEWRGGQQEVEFADKEEEKAKTTVAFKREVKSQIKKESTYNQHTKTIDRAITTRWAHNPSSNCKDNRPLPKAAPIWPTKPSPNDPNQKRSSIPDILPHTIPPSKFLGKDNNPPQKARLAHNRKQPGVVGILIWNRGWFLMLGILNAP